MRDELGFARSSQRPGGIITCSDEPQMCALGELLRKVGEDVREDFALATLRTADARQPDPIGGFRRGHTSPRAQLEARTTPVLLHLVFFKDIEGVAVVKLHAHRS